MRKTRNAEQNPEPAQNCYIPSEPLLALGAYASGAFYTSVPSGKRKQHTNSAPRASAIEDSSVDVNFPVFIRWLNADGVEPTVFARDASLIFL